MPYGDKGEVKALSGVKPEHLSFVDGAALDTWLDARLAEITDWINTYTGRDLEQEVIDAEIKDVPLGIDAVANQLGRNLVAVAIASRQSPIVRIDDWSVQIAEPEVFTKKAKMTLSLYRKRRPINAFVVRSERREEEEAEAES